MWHAKEPSLFNGHECRAYDKIWSPLPVIVTSPYHWKILEWDVKPPKKKTPKSFVTSFGCVGCTETSWGQLKKHYMAVANYSNGGRHIISIISQWHVQDIQDLTVCWLIDLLDSVLRRIGNILAIYWRRVLVKSDQFWNFKVCPPPRAYSSSKFSETVICVPRGLLSLTRGTV